MGASPCHPAVAPSRAPTPGWGGMRRPHRPWASQDVRPPQGWGCGHSHLCDNLAILRHIDLHGHASC